SETLREIPFKVGLSLTGKQVKYNCPRCGQDLASPLQHAGRQDTCPTCNAPFIVPGKSVKDEEEMRRRQKEREAERKRIEAERAQHFREMAKQHKTETQGAAPEYTWLFSLGRLIWVLGVIQACVGVLIEIYAVFNAIRNESFFRSIS